MMLRLLPLILIVALAGCSDRANRPVVPPPGDATVPDAAVPDAAVDGATPDATVPDASADAGVPDATAPDATIPDARPPTPDADVPDADVPDAMMDGGMSGLCPATDLGMREGVSLATGNTGLLSHIYTPGCGTSGAAPEAIFSWTAPRDGTFTIDSNDSTFDTILYVKMGDCSGLELDCDDDGGEGTRSRVRVTLTAGAMITILIDGYSGASGDYVLSITEAPETEAGLCMDGLDNDRDGEADCLDFDCSAEPGCTETDCGDGVDDDGDGAIDCDDFDCSGDPACTETDCTDGVDNDGDGLTDCEDFDCSRDPACSETDCADGVDDDGDGRIDCDDFDCFLDMACGESMCTDGVDDDSDTFTDCDDSECRCDPGCLVGGDGCATGSTDLMSRTGASVATGSIAAGLCSRRMGSCAGAGAEVYFEFTAPSAGSYTIDTLGSTFDTVLYALDMSCTGAELGCNDDSPSAPDTTSSLTLSLTAMQSIIIVLDSYSSGGSGDYVLNINAPPGPMPPPPPMP